MNIPIKFILTALTAVVLIITGTTTTYHLVVQGRQQGDDKLQAQIDRLEQLVNETQIKVAECKYQFIK